MHSKHESRTKRHRRIRKRVSGAGDRPRLAVFRSSKHIYAQVIDDLARRTLVAISDLDGGIREAAKSAKKRERAKQVGAAIAKRCLEKGIDKVVFDRAGYQYHGRVSALAEGARQAGLKF